MGLVMEKLNNYIENFKKYRYLLYQLVINDIKVKYRRSVLGIIWSILHPLLMVAVLTLVFSSLFKSDITHFAIYVLTGRIMWDLFAQSTSFAMSSISGNASLIKKVYVPKYIFPLAKCFFSLVNTLMALVALILIALFSGGVEISPALFLLPFPLLYTFIFAIGISLILAAYTVFFRDLEHLYEVLLTAWVYFTPIFYPISIIPENLKIFLKFNPIYHTLSMFRDVVMYGHYPTLEQHLICASIAFGSLFIGVFIFHKRQDQFILYV
jgi:ABC-2 type transport system permease protein